MNIEELITHTNIIIEEGLDSEDDIQLILKKWKTAYEKEKEKNKELERKIKIKETDIDIFMKKLNKAWIYKIKAKIEEYKKQIEKMEKDDIGRGFTLGKEWSDLKAKIEFGQSLLEKEE